MAALVAERRPIAAAVGERADLARVATALHSSRRLVKLIGPTGDEITLPSSLVEVLEQAVHDLTSGEAVAVVAVQAEMTTNQASDLLNVSRQYLVRLLDQGEIPFRRTGTHRRIRVADLLAYKDMRDSRRRKGLDELIQLSDDMGLYDLPLGEVECRRLEPS